MDLRDPGKALAALLGVETIVPGDQKYGRYIRGAEIGTGSMGRVFRAVDPLAKRVVAIKTLRAECRGLSTEAVYRQRFLREAEAAGRLSHPSVVRIFDQGDGYLVMELLTGKLLSTLQRERGTFTLAEAVPILATVADALDHAHARGVIHRDVRPANVLVQEDGTTKLLDFGLSRFVGEGVAPGDRFTGSVWYMAPEQITDGVATAQSDLFSLGAVAYEMLTGHRPFDGDNVGTVTYRIVFEAFDSATSRNPTLPSVVDDVFERVLCKDPGMRLPTVSAFVRALEAQVARSRKARPARQAPVAVSLETQDLRGLLPPPAAGGAAARPMGEPGACALEIASDPAGATVVVDGDTMGTTPLALTGVAAGTHALRVEAPGFAPVAMTLDLSPSPVAPRFAFALEPVGRGRKRASKGKAGGRGSSPFAETLLKPPS